MEAIGLLGARGGQVRTLSGFKKGFHKVPDAVNGATQGFVARIAAEDLEAEATQLYDALKSNFRYKRKEIQLELDSASAVIVTKDFHLSLTYAQDDAEATAYTITYLLNQLRDASVLADPGLQAILQGHFDEMRFTLAQVLELEVLIDTFEAEDNADATIDYPHDCQYFNITLPGCKWSLRATAHSVSILSPGLVTPGALLGYLRESQTALRKSATFQALFG